MSDQDTGAHKTGMFRGIFSGQRLKSIDWFQTLATSKQSTRPLQLRYKKHQSGQKLLHCVLLDTSASTVRDRQLSLAKSCIFSIRTAAYQQRDLFGLMTFGGSELTVVKAFGRTSKPDPSDLDQLPAGGGTPLLKALQATCKHLDTWRLRHPGIAIRVYLLTDGRTNHKVEGIRLPGEILLIDLEQSPLRIGRGAEIAKSLQAEYVPVEALG